MLPMLPHDKANHAIYGAGFGLLGAIGAWHLGFTPWMFALGLSAIAGVAKEIADKLGDTGTPSVPDALATVAGGVVVAVATML